MSMCGAQSVVRSSAPTMPRRKTQGGQHEEAPTATHTGGTLCTSVQRPAGHGPVRVRPTAGPQRLRQGQRLLHRPAVRRRGRERPRGRQTPVPGDDRGGKQTQRSLRGHPRLEVFEVHQEARTRRCVQVHAPAQGYQGGLHHGACRRLSHRQAHGGHHRECGRVLQRESCPGGRPGHEGVRIARLLPLLEFPLRL